MKGTCLRFLGLMYAADDDVTVTAVGDDEAADDGDEYAADDADDDVEDAEDSDATGVADDAV